jgi:hypothetical protein
MSRYYDDGDYDESFPNQGELWAANAHRALKGKRGRKVLAELREALLALPEKRLIASAMCTVAPDKRRSEIANDAYGYGRQEFDDVVSEQGEGVCAVGAFLWWRKVKAGADPAAAFDDLPMIFGDEDDGITQTANTAKREANVVFSLAWELAYRNDETYSAKTPEQRHEAFLSWIDEELGERVAAAASANGEV